MKTIQRQFGIAAALAALIAIAAPPAGAQQAAAPVAIDNDDIGGVVKGPGGPEAGVWVIAETRDLPVRYIKIVVTDDQGRYVIPDLPKANYDVWVRGYGLVDLPKVKSEPGKQLNLTAVPAPNEAEAAKYYPAIYWFAMMKIPEAEIFGSKDAPNNVKITDYLNAMKNNGCVGCHQLGQLSTRTIPKFHMDQGKTHEEAWVRRIQSGQAGENMVTIAAGQLGGMPFKYLGDWTERVAKGELPSSKPTRPQGVERNIVVTLRDWHNDKQYLHDLISTDRRYPTVNGYGPLYGQCEHACNDMPILDPVKNVATNFVLPTTADMPLALGPGNAGSVKILMPSAYWGEENLWDSKANNHNSMIDAVERRPDGGAQQAEAGGAPVLEAAAPAGEAVREARRVAPPDEEVRHVLAIDRQGSGPDAGRQPVAAAAEVHPERRPRPVAVAGRDRLDDPAMVRADAGLELPERLGVVGGPRQLRARHREPRPGHQHFAEIVEQPDEMPVAGRLGDRPVKGDVERDRLLAPRQRRVHGVAGGLDRRELLRRPAAGGEGGGLRLDGDADLQRLEQILGERELVVGDAEGRHRRLLEHEGALALVGGDEAARLQVGDRLAHHGPADVELLDQVLLGRDLVARLVLLGLDALGERLDQHRGQRLPRHAPHVHLPQAARS